jgi:hypothetical protein
MMRVAIVQSSYIPWRGYFSLIRRADRFIFLDSVQFTRRDWRSRNRIKTAQGTIWLTVPVRQRGNYHAAIDRIEIATPDWAERHLRTIEAAYHRAPGYDVHGPAIAAAYREVARVTRLSEVNQRLTAVCCGLLGIATSLGRDGDLLGRDALERADPTDRLVALAAAAGATTYISGPTARAYLDPARFEARGIAVEWMDYGGLRPYAQLWGAFDPQVSVVDLLLNAGRDAPAALV